MTPARQENAAHERQNTNELDELRRKIDRDWRLIIALSIFAAFCQIMALFAEARS